MTELFNDQGRCILINNLVDRDHRAHVEQDLDHLVTLDRHFLCEFSYADTLRNFDFAYNRGCWHFETMLRIATNGRRTTTKRRLAFASATLVAGNMQFFSTVTRLRTVGLRLGLFLFLCPTGACVSFGLLQPGLLFCGRSGRLFRLGASFVFCTLGSQRFFRARFFLAFRGGNFLSLDALFFSCLGSETLFRFLALTIQRVLLILRLLLENIALDVGALLANLNADRSGSSLGTGQAKLGRRFSLKRNSPWRRRSGGRIVLAVTATQVSQQFQFRIFTDFVIRSLDLNASLVKLRKQLVDRNLQYFSKLCNCHISHILTPQTKAVTPVAPLRTSAHVPS